MTTLPLTGFRGRNGAVRHGPTRMFICILQEKRSAKVGCSVREAIQESYHVQLLLVLPECQTTDTMFCPFTAGSCGKDTFKQINKNQDAPPQRIENDQVALWGASLAFGYPKRSPPVCMPFAQFVMAREPRFIKREQLSCTIILPALNTSLLESCPSATLSKGVTHQSNFWTYCMFISPLNSKVVVNV